jgi:RHS repeat-associated protein
MKKPPQAQKAVATQPVRSKFPFIGASWVLIGVSGVAIALCVAAGATDILRGHVRVEERSSTGQAKPSSPAMQKATSGKANDLVTEYGPAARSPAVAAAIKRAESTPGAKAAADRQEALAHGVWRSGADPMQAIMYGYVPPGMPPQQAAMLYSTMPHMPKMPQPMPPEITDPDPVRDMLRAQGLEQFNNPAANQQMVEGYMRERFGPVYVPPLQRGHNHPPDGITISRVATTVNTKDDQGSIREMVDASGNLVAEYAYDPYGRQTRIGGAGPDSDFGYAGYYVHSRSGLNLTATRAYSPSLGRFINRDPSGEEGGINLYAYVMNNPIGHSDPTGLGDNAACCKAKADVARLVAALEKRIREQQNGRTDPGVVATHVKAFEQKQVALRDALRRWKLYCKDPPPKNAEDLSTMQAPVPKTDSNPVTNPGTNPMVPYTPLAPGGVPGGIEIGPYGMPIFPGGGRLVIP